MNVSIYSQVSLLRMALCIMTDGKAEHLSCSSTLKLLTCSVLCKSPLLGRLCAKLEVTLHRFPVTAQKCTISLTFIAVRNIVVIRVIGPDQTMLSPNNCIYGALSRGR